MRLILAFLLVISVNCYSQESIKKLPDTLNYIPPATKDFLMSVDFTGMCHFNGNADFLNRTMCYGVMHNTKRKGCGLLNFDCKKVVEKLEEIDKGLLAALNVDYQNGDYLNLKKSP